MKVIYGRRVRSTQGIYFIAALLAAGMATSAAAQLSLISATGTMTDGNSRLLFDFNTSADYPSSDDLFFRTYTNAGGTNVLGETFAPGGIDSDLTLTRVTNTVPPVTVVVGQSDNFGGTADALLTFPLSPLQTGTPLPDPLPADRYTLELTPFGSSSVSLGDGRFAIDLVSEGQVLDYNAIFDQSGTTLDTLTLAAGVGGGIELETSASQGLYLRNTLDVGLVSDDPLGPAVLNVNGGTVEVDNQTRVSRGGLVEVGNGARLQTDGVLQVNPGGIVHIQSTGTLAAGSNFDINGGTLDVDNESLQNNWANGNILVGRNEGQIETTGNFILAGGRAISLESGADLRHVGSLTIGEANDNVGVFLTGAGTTLDVTGQAFVALASSTADLTVTNGAAFTADLFSVGGFTTNASVATASFSDGASATIDGTVAIGFVANLGNDFDGTATLTVTGESTTSIPTTFTQTAGDLSIGNDDPEPGTGTGDHRVVIENQGLYDYAATGSSDAFTIRKTGTLRLGTDGTLRSSRDIDIVGGTLRVNGVVVGNVNNAGTVIADSVDTGNSLPDDLLIQGNYTQTSAGRLEIGRVAGLGFSGALQVQPVSNGPGGNATLGGELAFIASDPLAEFGFVTAYDNNPTTR